MLCNRTATTHRLILDTDIGSDVDDALALGVLLGSSEVELLGCTTVYGDTTLRARIARRLIRLAGRDPERIPCIPGASQTLSGRKIWWAGHEGALYKQLDRESVDDTVPGYEWLARRVAQEPGRIDVIAIGPLTNIALAIRFDPAFVTNIRRLWIMGGCYDDPTSPAEHNFISDSVAAAEVIGSGLPLTLTGVELTQQVRLTSERVLELNRGGRLGELLERETRAWMAHRNKDFDVPHDATTVLAMLRPDLFTCRSAMLTVNSDGGKAGMCRVEEPSATVSANAEIVTMVAADVVVDEILARIKIASVAGSAELF